MDWRLEAAETVFFLEFLHFFAHKGKIGEQAAHFLGIFGCDVAFAQNHQVVDVVAGIEKHAAHCRVGNHVFHEGYRSHVHSHKFLHIFHLVVERHFHLFEDARNHLLTHEVVVVEGPPEFLVIFFCNRLADVVEQSRPAEPLVVALLSHTVEHLKGVHEIVFVSSPVHRLHPFEGCEFGKNEFEKSAFVEQDEPDRRFWRTHNLVQLIDDALLGDDVDALAVASNGIECLGEDVEIELGGKPHGAHHAQRVVAECDVGVERGADDSVVEVVDTTEWVDECSKRVGI